MAAAATTVAADGIGTVSPDGGFYVNKVKVTITPAAGKTIYYAVGGRQPSAATSPAVTAPVTVWVSTPGPVTVTDGTVTQQSAAFDFTFSTSDNYLNYYHNGSSTQVVNTGGGKDAITVFFQTYNTDTHVYAWDYAKDAWYKGERGSSDPIEGKYVALTSDIPGAALLDVNRTTFNGMPFYYFTTLRSSLTAYTDTRYGNLGRRGVSFLTNRGLDVDDGGNVVETYKTADEAGIFFNSFYVYGSNGANQAIDGPRVGTYNNILSRMNVHYNGKMTDSTQVALTGASAHIVYFYKPANWNTVYCYAYGNGVTESWPGTAMTPVPGTTCLYYTTFASAPGSLIFSDNGSADSALRSTPDQGAGYAYRSGSYYVTGMGEGADPAGNDIYGRMTALVEDNAGGNIVFFYKPTGWEKACCYAYNVKDERNADYPGATMAGRIAGTDIWYCTLDSRYTHMVFNNGTTSTDIADRSNEDKAAGYAILNGGLYAAHMGAGAGPCDLLLRKESADRYEKFLGTAATSTVTSTFYPNGEDYYRNMTGDQTLALDPSWAGSTAVATTDEADWSGRTVSYPDENNAGVNDLPRQVAADTEISQSVTGLDASALYTVQAVVKGADVTLTLTSSEDGKEKTVTTAAGTTPREGSPVTRSGRIEKLEPLEDREAGWYKVEATARPATNGLLTIALKGDGTFLLADVTLLRDANTAAAGHIWTTAPLTNEVTYADYSDRATHNAYSFFDRGRNPNGLVAADHHTVIADAASYLDADAERPDYADRVLPAPYNIVRTDGAEVLGCRHLYLTEQAEDGTAYDAADTENGFFASGWSFGTPVAFTAADITFDRVLPAHESTLVMPFAITADELREKFGAPFAYTFGGVDDRKMVHLTRVTAIPANTPAIVKGKGDGKLTFTGVDKDIAVTDSRTPATVGSNGSRFTGQYEYLGGVRQLEGGTADDPEYINYNFRPSDGRFMLFADGGDVKPFRAYLHYRHPSGASAKRAMGYVVDDGEATGMDEARLPEEEQDGPVYGIDGRRVAAHTQDAALPRGFYIRNGRKFIVK